MIKRLITFITFIFIILIGIILYGRFISTKGLITNEIKIEVENLDKDYNGFKVVQFSDLHYGTTINKDEFDKVVNEINLLKPDLVLFTGDLLDETISLSVEDYDNLTKELANINANIGKYAISGNHDTNEKWESVIKNGGFVNINDSYQLIYNNSTTPIILSGLSSSIGTDKTVESKIKSIDEYINSLEQKPMYSILMMHEPDSVDNINTDNYNLILAGHSHGGLIKIAGIDNLLLPEGAKKYYKSHYKINNSSLYVSNGLGTSKIKFRFMNKPSINFFRIVKK